MLGEPHRPPGQILYSADKTRAARGPSHRRGPIPAYQVCNVVPVSIEAKPKQKTQQDAETARPGLAAVGRYAGRMIPDTIAPLEILNNLLFLARRSRDPEKVREYLEEAEVHLRTVGDINLDILRFYVKYAGDVVAMREQLPKAG